jgi:hypothetical protein
METALAAKPLDQNVDQVKGVSNVRADHLDHTVHLRFADQSQFFLKLVLVLIFFLIELVKLDKFQLLVLYFILRPR